METPSSYSDLFTQGEYADLQHLTDAVIKTEDGRTFDVHRVILASQSKFFKAAFSQERCRQQSHPHCVTISNISGSTLDKIIVFIYTKKVSFDNQDISDLLLAANYLMVDYLIEHCRSYFSKNMKVSNALPVFIAASHLDHLNMLDPCYRFLQLHFADVMTHWMPHVGEIPHKAFVKLIEDTSLNVQNEGMIWRVIKEWVSADAGERLAMVPDLITCLRLSADDEELASNILSHPLVHDNEHCSSLNEINNSGQFETKLDVLKFHFTARNRDTTGPRVPQSIQFVIHFYRNERMECDLYVTYDNVPDICRYLTHLYFEPRQSLVSLSHFVFLDQYDKIAKFDFQTNSRVDIQPLVGRHNYAMVAVEDHLYAVGGDHSIFGKRDVPVVERYDHHSNTWTRVSDMLPMEMVEAVSMNGLIFVIGYVEADDKSMAMQSYDPQKDKWTYVAPPVIMRYYYKTIVLDGHLYVISGWDSEHLTLKSVERYNPSTNLWQSLPDMPMPIDLDEIPDEVITLGGTLFATWYSCWSIRWNDQGQVWEVQDFIFNTRDLSDLDFQSYEVTDPSIVIKVMASNKEPGLKWTKSILKKKYLKSHSNCII